MAQMVNRAQVRLLMRLTHVQSSLLPNIFSPFSNLVLHRKGIYFQYKLRKKKNNENKSLGSVRVGVGRALFNVGGINLRI